jgi:glutathione S-transferase
MLKLYGIGKTRWNRPYFLLQELGLKFEPVIIDPRIGEHRSPEFLLLNPLGKLPVLVDKDTVVTESIAICLYLAEKYPESQLVPLDPLMRCRMYQWLFFCSGEMEAPLQRMDLHLYHYPEERKLPAEVANARQDYRRAAAVLETHLQDREFVVGKTLTVADVALSYVLVWAYWEQMLDDFPSSTQYLERLMERPSFPVALKTAPLAD